MLHFPKVPNLFAYSDGLAANLCSASCAFRLNFVSYRLVGPATNGISNCLSLIHVVSKYLTYFLLYCGFGTRLSFLLTSLSLCHKSKPVLCFFFSTARNNQYFFLLIVKQ